MISLDSPRWAELEHAYGVATDIPSLLRALQGLPECRDEKEPWFSLWSALAHQGDVYSASFAAVPYVVKALASDPAHADSVYFQFPAWVEICRKQKQVAIPDDIRSAYEAALLQLPGLVAAAATREWDSGFLCCALAAVAAAKGHTDVAEAALELDAEVARAFIEWFHDR